MIDRLLKFITIINRSIIIMYLLLTQYIIVNE